MSNKLRSTVTAVMLLAPAALTFIAEPAAAQQRATVAAPAIVNMALNSDAGLAPGATLRVQVYGTPDARRGKVTLGDSGITVRLREQSPGNYIGTHVIRRGERIDPLKLMTASLTYGDRDYSRHFYYPTPFQALAMGAAPAVAQSDLIERFVMRPMGNIKPGRELRFRVRGVAGARASLEIPGVDRRLDLVEVRPGVYEGSYTVRNRDNPDAFARAVATLRTGNRVDTARLDLRDRDLAGDERAPRVTDLSPANGERIDERGRARLSARLQDEGSGIDRDSVRLRLNGRDVTADARVTDDEVRYRSDLEPGHYTAEVRVRDEAGNQTRQAWTFEVRDDRRADADRLPLRLTSHADNAVVDANGNLVIEGRTAPGASVRVQVDSVANVAGLLGVTQELADRTVRADRNGRFDVTVVPSGLPIPGTRYEVELTATSGNQTAHERLTLIQRQG